MSQQLRKAIQQTAGTLNLNTATYYVCKVTAVNEAQRTCDVVTISEYDNDIPEVSLMPSVDDGFLLVPAIDSEVLVGYKDGLQPYVAMFSQLDKILAVVGDSGIGITATSIKLNDGSLGGLIKILELVSKLNNIENDLNDLKTIFSTWTPVYNDGGAALKTAAGAWYGKRLTPTQKKDIENPNITHGESL